MDWNSVNFDWNHARAFLLSAEQGSLSAAARLLNTSQPTLSRQVAALEQALGITLFERVGKGLQLTESGAALLEHLRPMGEAANRFALSAAGQSQQVEGPVCIAASEIDAIFRLPAVIAAIRQREPGIQLEIVVSNSVSDLQRREADIAIRSFRPEQPDLIARKLADEPIWLYGSHEYLKTFGPVQDNNHTIGHDLQIIGFERNDRLMNILNQHGWQLTPKHFAIVTTFQMLQWQLVKQGNGLGFFPQQIGDAEPAFRRAFSERGSPLTVPLWLVCHRELRTNPRVKRVFDLLAEMLAEEN
ncbi:MAG: LysR family transcriptional regulator [Saccharospirillaceae bacterium]|nr:LysR family transcriptional regulator [Saccharospirillaceae bacterium]MCD8530188.1 LysR family transcriptional regulator [Saccharospirillaceae bacterium]